MQQANNAARPATPVGKALRFPLTRIVLALLFVMGGQSVLSLLVRGSVGTPVVIVNSPPDFLLVVAQVLVALLSYAAYVRLVERRPVRELSLVGAPRELGAGLLVGAGLFTAIMGVVWLLGGHEFTGANGPAAALTALGYALGAASVEEVVSRGVLFRIVEGATGTWISLAITAALFGALHLFSPGATVQGAVAIALSAGVLLAAAYVLTRRLWLAIGIHAAWNFVQGGIFGVSVSGHGVRGILEGHPAGPGLISGGAFGVEASVITVAAVGALGALFLVRATRKGNVVAPPWRRGGEAEGPPTDAQATPRRRNGSA